MRWAMNNFVIVRSRAKGSDVSKIVAAYNESPKQSGRSFQRSGSRKL